jgi:hypothetical protein
MDMLTKIFPGQRNDEFEDDPILKFAPFGTPYNHALPNAEKSYAQLIQEQNQFLQEHIGIPVGGIHTQDWKMDFLHHQNLAN